ncbi:MAG: hypothetical protein KGJ62_04050 [Armatimonadetes bacterium]|nr:hypothetical protein [Armatimonadota bacterium]MDE2205655.1 hypothetical protein [Armatimonadota bacterium]
MMPTAPPPMPNVTPPVPVRRRGGSGCLVPGILGCGALVVILVVIGIIGVSNLNKHGGFGNIVRSAEATTPAARKLWYLREGMDLYRRAHKGAYPKTLDAVLPFIPPADEDPTTCTECSQPQAIYIRPGPATNPHAPIVQFFAGEGDLTIGPVTQRHLTYISLLANGEITQDQNVQQVLYPAADTSAPIPPAPLRTTGSGAK